MEVISQIGSYNFVITSTEKRYKEVSKVRFCMSAFWASCSFLISEPFFGFGCWVFFAAMAVALESVPGRAHMQDWRTFPFFLTQEIWKHLEETPGLPQMNRMERLSRFLVNALGMRNPSEQTMAVMCALICRSCGMERCFRSVLEPLLFVQTAVATSPTELTRFAADLLQKGVGCKHLLTRWGMLETRMCFLQTNWNKGETRMCFWQRNINK